MYPYLVSKSRAYGTLKHLSVKKLTNRAGAIFSFYTAHVVMGAKVERDPVSPSSERVLRRGHLLRSRPSQIRQTSIV